MIKEEDVFRIGALAKTHGLRGEIAFRFDNDIFDRVEYPYLFLKIDGILIPFFIEEYRFKGNDVALILFQDIDNEEKASRLQNLEVFYPREYMHEELANESADLSWEFFVGFAVFDKLTGKLGTIVEINTQTINTLFIILSEDEDEILIPAVEEFIEKIDPEQKELYLNLPEGMI